jgi:hypothetical protein
LVGYVVELVVDGGIIEIVFFLLFFDFFLCPLALFIGVV